MRVFQIERGESGLTKRCSNVGNYEAEAPLGYTYLACKYPRPYYIGCKGSCIIVDVFCRRYKVFAVRIDETSLTEYSSYFPQASAKRTKLVEIVYDATQCDFLNRRNNINDILKTHRHHNSCY
ncbi:hypothetical protein D3C76_950470 [compost metagenome]